MATLSTRVRQLAEARQAIERFVAVNWSQRHIKALLLQMFAYIEANYCRAGTEADLERWWEVIRIYRRTLESPRLAAKGGRRLTRKVLDLPWDRLQKPGVIRRLLGPAPDRVKKRVQARAGTAKARFGESSRRSVESLAGKAGQSLDSVAG